MLLCAVYKVLTAILTDRLAAVAEKYGLLSSSQEGFQQHRNCTRQLQLLLWGIEKSRREGTKLYTVFVNFENTFNSLDHGAIWAWLKLMNVLDIDLLQELYEGSFFQVDSDFGRTARVFLMWGLKQDDTSF